MSITKPYNKHTNTYYAYETTYEWDDAKQKKIQRKHYIDQFDPDTGKIIPNGKERAGNGCGSSGIKAFKNQRIFAYTFQRNSQHEVRDPSKHFWHQVGFLNWHAPPWPWNPIGETHIARLRSYRIWISRKERKITSIFWKKPHHQMQGHGMQSFLPQMRANKKPCPFTVRLRLHQVRLSQRSLIHKKYCREGLAAVRTRKKPEFWHSTTQSDTRHWG